MGCTPCGKRYLCTPKKRKHERQYRLRQHGDSAVVPQTADPYRSGNGFLGGVRHHGRHFRRPRRRQRRAGGSQYHGAAVPHQYGRGTDVRCRRFGRGVDPPRTRKGQDGADQRDAGRRRFVAAARGIQPRDLSVRTRRGCWAARNASCRSCWSTCIGSCLFCPSVRCSARACSSCGSTGRPTMRCSAMPFRRSSISRSTTFSFSSSAGACSARRWPRVSAMWSARG